MSNKRLQADLMLLVTALVWGSVFSIQRIASQSAGVFPFNGMRFLVGALVLLVGIRFRWHPTRRQLGWMLLAGLFLFIGANLQQLGLRTTTAGNGGFITGTYVVFIPILLYLFLRQLVSIWIWAAVLVTALGVFLLSANGFSQWNTGDLLVLIGAMFWAGHVIVVGRAMQECEALPFAIGQYLVVGLLSLPLGTIFEPASMISMINVWWTILYAGVFSVAAGFTLQASAQKYAPPADAAILMSLEAVFAVIFGWWWLGENLLPVQLLGCALILFSALFVQFLPLWQKR